MRTPETRMKGAGVLAAWALLLLLALPPLGPSLAASASAGSAVTRALQAPPTMAIPRTPFVENDGQVANHEVRFFLGAGSTQFGFADRAVLVRLTAATGDEALVRATFEGANRVAPEGRDLAAEQNHYFLGSDPARWRTDVPTFQEVVYENLYAGIDLRYRVASSGVKYEFDVAAGANPAGIQIGYDGIDRLALAPEGELIVHTAAGDLQDTAPVAVQTGAAVTCAFALRGPRSIGFDCRGQDPSRPFTIDPILFATYLGGSAPDEAHTVAVDGAGNVYVAGWTNASDFPTTPGAYDRTYDGGSQDVFVAKFDPTGARLLYATFVGGRDWDGGYALAVDAAGNAFVAGQTYSSDFPTTPGAFSQRLNGPADAFLLKLDASGGGLVYSTFLGGSVVERIYGLVLDLSGDAFVAGETASPDFPTTPGAFSRVFGGGLLFDAFVAALDGTGGSLLFSTFLGGNSADSASAIARDGTGALYVTGVTTSTNFPATAGAFSSTLHGNGDAFVAKLDPTGSSLLYATYLGGTGSGPVGDVGWAIAVDASGHAYVGGSTNTPDFPVTPTAWDTSCGTDGNCNFDGFQPYSDGFVTELNASGSGLVYSTYLGGASHDNVYAIAIDGLGRAVVAGDTRSLDFPTTPGADNATFLGGLTDAFVTKLNPSGSALVNSTFLGGGLADQVYGLALDGSGATYVAGVTSSTDFPATSGSYATTYAGGATDAFVAKLGLGFPITLATNPAGLQVTIDANTLTAPTVYVCDPGTSPSVGAPDRQVLSGVQYNFSSWSDSGAQVHTITCVGPASLTATFVVVAYMVTVATSPPGLEILVDGSPHPAPYDFLCAAGSSPLISVRSPQVFGMTQYVYASWSDGGLQSHTIPCNAAAAYTAGFSVEYETVVTAVPTACGVTVDAVPYVPPATFWWGEGTAHTIAVPPPPGSGGTRYLFSRWSDGGAQSHSVIANVPQTLTAYCLTQYNETVTTVPPGLQVLVNGTAYAAPYSFWCNASATVDLGTPSPQVFGSTRYRFSNWSDAGAQGHTVTCASSMTYRAGFTTEYETNVDTIPIGLIVTVDGANRTAPYTLWCLQGTTHTLDAPSPQTSGGTRYVFQSWSDGGGRQHSIGCAQPMNYSAVFDTEYLVTIATLPPGLHVNVDGADATAPATYWWVAGSTHRVNATSPQGSGGSQALFQSWSDGGTQVHDVTVTGPATLAARYLIEHQVTFDTSPSGLRVTVNGTSYPTPVTLALPAGSVWAIGIPSPQNGTAGVRYAWGPTSSWSDGGAQTHTITVTGPMTFVATLETQYLLTLASAHGSPWCDHNDAGCWYSKDETATFEIDPIVSGGADIQYVFRGWFGDINPTNWIFIVLMDGPKKETAQWQTQYYLHVIATPGASTGDGWYDAGTLASFAVNATEVTGPDGKRYRFAGWRGNFTGAGANGSTVMDGPKNVIAQWSEIPFLDSMWWLFLLPVVAAFLILILLVWRRRRKAEPEETPETEEGAEQPGEPAPGEKPETEPEPEQEPEADDELEL